MNFALAAWSNAHFQNNLFPRGTPAKEQLPRYAKAFGAVEVSRFFHNTPPEEEMLAWREQTPKGFHFLAKAPRAVTHSKKGTDTVAIWEQFRADVSCLNPSKYLMQFQSNFRFKPENMDWLEQVLGPDVAVEFRHDSWFNEEVKQMLTAKGAALVWGTYPGAIAPHWKTADWGYIRFVGNNIPERGGKPEFNKQEIPDMNPTWDECFVVITNPFEGDALLSMPRVAKMLGQRVDLGACHRDLGQQQLF